MIVIDDLRKFHTFSDWSDEELDMIVPYLEEENLKKNKILFTQQAPGDKIYFIKSGCIELKISLTVREEARLAQVKSGEMFGEMSVIDGRSRSATALAFVDTKLLVLTKDKFYNFLKENNKTVTNKLLLDLIKEVSLRLRAVDDEIRNMKLFT